MQWNRPQKLAHGLFTGDTAETEPALGVTTVTCVCCEGQGVGKWQHSNSSTSIIMAGHKTPFKLPF